MSMFTGTARYYRLYRPGIPPEAARLPAAQVTRTAAPRRLFSQVEETRIPVWRIWTPERVIGYLYSSSFAARPLFGDRIEEFEAAATDLLTQHSGSAALVERACFQVILACRPLM